jgi:excinuclease UvrABC ATPase subunit
MRRRHGVLYIFDDDTGPHFSDVNLLLACFEPVRADNTVLVVEHNMDVVKCADWVIDPVPKGRGRWLSPRDPDEVAPPRARTPLYPPRARERIRGVAGRAAAARRGV